MYILLNNINIFLPQSLPCLTKLLFWWVAVNTFTVLCVYDMALVLLESNGKTLMKWLSEQFWRCSCMSSISETADAEVIASITRFSLCVVNKRERYREQTAPYAFESLSRMSNWSIWAASLLVEHILVLQAYCLTDVDEINPLGIEIWYRTTRCFSILDGIEATRSVPKKYQTWYPALSARSVL